MAAIRLFSQDREATTQTAIHCCSVTIRQLQILAEIAKGLTDKEVARARSLSPRTVEMHVARALAALDCRSRTEAVRKVTDLGMFALRS